MPAEIENLTQKPIFLRLNSGKTLHLAPGLKSPQIGEFEWKNNDKVKKLEDLRAIALHPVLPPQTTPAKSTTTTTKAKTTTENGETAKS